MITIDKLQFELVKEHRDCFDEEGFKQKYTEALDKYDVIVGDYSSNILRLKGFTSKHPDSIHYINTIPDYINESCNYNCQYFIIKRVKNV